MRMLRWRYGLSPVGKDVLEVPDALPHLLLVDRFRVMTNFHEVFSTLASADFKMEEEVILESLPNPAPQPAPEKGTVTLLESSTDFLKIQADVSAPTLLLITDSYSSGWRRAGAAGQHAGALRSHAGQLLFAGDSAGGGPSSVAGRVFAAGFSRWQGNIHRCAGAVYSIDCMALEGPDGSRLRFLILARATTAAGA